MRRARCHQLLGIICLCLLPRLALADAAQARVHFERGRTFFEVDEYRKAIAEFKAAHIEKPDPAFLYNIAECHRRLGEASDALVYLPALPGNGRTRRQDAPDRRTAHRRAEDGRGRRETAGGRRAACRRRSRPGA